MSIQQLPFELMENIFRNLVLNPYQKNYLTDCAQVCQLWYLPACRVLYEKLVVKNISLMLEHLRSQENNMGIYCKELRFANMYEKEPIPLEEYQQILSYLPNIRTITLDSCALRSRHLKQLALYPELIKNVKAILLTGGWRSGELQDYYLCANAFRNNLQHITLSSLGETITTIDGEFGYMVTFLQDFSSLTTLQIKNTKSIYVSGLPRLSMFSIMRSCPNLVSFSIENDYQEPEDDDDDVSTFDHSTLRSLDIHLPEITKHQINYLVKNITQLKQFNLKCGSAVGSQVSIKWMEKIGPDLLNHFERYLARIERVELDIGKNYKTDILKYWPFISNIISNSRSTPTHIYMMLNVEGMSCFLGRAFVLSKQPESTNLQFRINGNSTPIGSLLTSSALLSAIVPPTDLGKKKIASFHVYFQPRWNDPDPFYSRRLNIIENIINCYPNILDFSIREDPSFKGHFQIKVASNDIEDVRFELLQNCLAINSPRLPTAPEDQLSYVTLQNMRSSEDIASVLNLLPNTKYLKLLECSLTRNNEFNYPIDMNNLSLEKLTLDITQLTSGESGQQTYALQIEEKDLNRTLCYKWKRESKKFETMVFESVKPSFLTQYGRFSSANFHVIIIKCRKLEEIYLYVKRQSQNTWKSDSYIDATVNLNEQ